MTCKLEHLDQFAVGKCQKIKNASRSNNIRLGYLSLSNRPHTKSITFIASLVQVEYSSRKKVPITVKFQETSKIFTETHC